MANKKNASVPEGFNVKVGREDGDGWAKKEKGNTIQGRLMGRYSFHGSDGRMRAFYQVALQNPCKATRKMDDESDKLEEITLKAGDIVNIDEVAKMKDLATKCDDGGVYDVWLQFGEKIKRKGTQNTPWQIEGPYLKIIKAPTKRSDDIPF